MELGTKVPPATGNEKRSSLKASDKKKLDELFLAPPTPVTTPRNSAEQRMPIPRSSLQSRSSSKDYEIPEEAEAKLEAIASQTGSEKRTSVMLPPPLPQYTKSATPITEAIVVKTHRLSTSDTLVILIKK